MGYLSSARKARIKARIVTKEAQLTAARTAYDAALASADTESYKFDSREGRQETVLRSPSVIAREIDRLESEIDRLYRKLEGGGLVSLNLRRR